MDINVQLADFMGKLDEVVTIPPLYYKAIREEAEKLALTAQRHAWEADAKAAPDWAGTEIGARASAKVQQIDARLEQLGGL